MSRYRSTSLRIDGSVSNSLKRQSRIVKQVGSKLVSHYLLRSLQSRTRRPGRIVLTGRDLDEGGFRRRPNRRAGSGYHLQLSCTACP